MTTYMYIKRIISLILLTVGWNLAMFGQSNQTSDHIVISAISDSQGNPVTAIPVDGSISMLTFSLVGGLDNSSRLYTAYNMDIQLPYGMETCYEDGIPSISLPSDFSFYASGISTLSHTLSASILSNGSIRIACFSGRNAHFAKTSGVLFQMPVRITSPYVCPGAHEIRITGQNLTVQDGAQKFVPADRSESISIAEGEATVQLNIPAEIGYSTCVLPFNSSLPDGIKAFSCSNYSDETVYLQRATSLQAYTPYILYAATGFTGTLSGNLSATAYQASVTDGIVRSGYLCGAVAPQTITAGFVLQNLGEGIKFYFTAGESFRIPSGKCWLELSKSNARALSFQIIDSETGISLPSVQSEERTLPYYDLSGRRIYRPEHGIYIHNNRKLVK